MDQHDVLSTKIPSSSYEHSRNRSDDIAPRDVSPVSISGPYLRNSMAHECTFYDCSGSMTPSITHLEGERKHDNMTAKHNAVSVANKEVRTGFSSYNLELWRNRWTAEMCSCVFASLSLVGLIVTLLAHRNKPLPQWPQIVSLNSIVSLFSMLMRAGVGLVLAEGISQSKWQWFRGARKLNDMERFDSASRGAWGSFLLILNLSPKRPHAIAALGAFLTIMATLTGFATQQLVLFKDCQQPDNTAVVSVSRTNSYSLQGFTGDVQTFRHLAPPLAIGVAEPMAAAIEIGIIQPVQDQTNVLSHGCDTGNCTFLSSEDGASFSTVGVGYECENVTSQVVEYTSQVSRGSYVLYSANLTSPRGVNRTESGNFTLEDPRWAPVSEIGLITGDTLVTGAHDGHGMIGIVQIMFRKGQRVSNHTAVNCSIFPTINTYSVTIDKTVMREKLLESVRIGYNLAKNDKKSGEKSEIGNKRVTSRTLKNGRWETCQRQDTPGPGLIVVAEGNIDAAPDFTNERQYKLWYYPEDCVWTFGTGALSGTSAYIKKIFAGQRSSVRYSIHLQRLWRDGNITMNTIDGFMKDLTTSMTTAVRSNGSPGQQNSSVNGTVWYTTTCLRIDWLWLSFPATMISLTLVFLVLVQIESREVESEKLWKSSILATLFCEIDETVQEVRPVGRSDVKDIANSTSVTLGSDGQQLRLVARKIQEVKNRPES